MVNGCYVSKPVGRGYHSGICTAEGIVHGDTHGLNLGTDHLREESATEGQGCSARYGMGHSPYWFYLVLYGYIREEHTTRPQVQDGWRKAHGRLGAIE